MRADICDPEDDAAIARFRRALGALGAQLSEQSWGLGVDVYKLAVRGQVLTIFSDAWSIDIEGPDDVVRAVIEEFRKNGA